MNLKFTFCNESLPSIIAGLDPQKEDAILAIGGSGDQAFALLEFGCRVYVIDYDNSQINFIKSVFQILKNRDFDSFIYRENNDKISQFIKERIGVDMFEQRNTYFNNQERFNKICSNLDNLTIIEPAQSIFDFLEQNHSSKNSLMFSKIYLSNIFTTMSNYRKDGSKGEYDFQDFPNSLSIIGLNILEGGLIYFADGDVIKKRLKMQRFNALFTQKFTFEGTTLQVNKRYTKKARNEQKFPNRVPLVLQKNS